jgi:dTDP-4-dehydrorhamnose reductase
MKILVFGASGLLGYAVSQVSLRRNHKTTAIYHRNPIKLQGLEQIHSLDLMEEDAVQRILFDEWPDAVVNAAAISQPDLVDSDPQMSFKINVSFSKKLAQLTNHIGAKLIHISTDMVFDGEDPEYRSTSMPNPLTTYGQQKLLAEKEVLKHGGQNVVVLRSTILNGNSMTGQRSLHESLIRAAMSGKKVNLFTDEFRQPCHASNLAEIIVELIERSQLHGIFHWGGTELVSRYQMGIAIMKRFALPTDCIVASTHKNLPPGIKRPKSLRLILDPLMSKVKTKPQNFYEQLQELELNWDLYQWFKKNTRDPESYVFKIVL